MDLACSEAQLRKLLTRTPFIRHLNLLLVEIADGECSIDVPFNKELERPGGIVAGPTFMAAADVAMWFAIKTKLGMPDTSVTAEMKTTFLRSAKKQGFRCTARVLKLGRQLVYGVADCSDNSGRLLTHHTITYIRRNE